MSEMHSSYHESFKPFQSRLFGYMMILSVLFLIVGNTAVYYASSSFYFQNIRTDLIDIATEAAKNTPIHEHELITKTDQLTSSEYETVEKYFQSIITANPKIDDVYSLRPTGKKHLLSFVVSGMTTADHDQNGQIDENEIKPSIGELYDTADSPAMEQGLKEPVADSSITYDKWGSWISGYAPLRNEEGVPVGVVGVDFSADILIQERWRIVYALLICDAILIPLLILSSYFVSRRVNRPLVMLGEGMDHVIHGDTHYELPYHGYVEDKMFAELFNRMKDTLSGKNKS